MMASICFKRFNDNCLFALTALFVLICLVISCGKKGPPVPPRYIEPPAITDLTRQIEADQLTLTWGFRKGNGGLPFWSGFSYTGPRKPLQRLRARTARYSLLGLPMFPSWRKCSKRRLRHIRRRWKKDFAIFTR